MFFYITAFEKGVLLFWSSNGFANNETFGLAPPPMDATTPAGHQPSKDQSQTISPGMCNPTDLSTPNWNQKLILEWTVFAKKMFLLFAVDSLFLVTLSAYHNNVSHHEVVPWDLDPINVGGHFSLTLHAYIAPVNGYYQ